MDITQRKLTESALQRAKENEEQLRRAATILAGSIAHDLRSPIACLNLYIKMLSTEYQASASSKVQDILYTAPS